MIDSNIRKVIDPYLNTIGNKISKNGYTANHMTILGFCCGLLAMLLLILNHYYMAAIFLIFNRIFDGLDGAVARNTKLTDFGGFLDIVCDFIIYSGIVFALGYNNPKNWLYLAFLMYSFIGPMASFLAYAAIAAKRNITTEKRGKKSFYYMGGICEGTETIIALVILCLAPDITPQICITYSILCWLTTMGRIYSAYVDFSK